VQTDDALTMLPFSVLKFNNAEIGLIYTIENIRLANKSKKTPMMSVQKNDNLDAFGASKGNKEFSKLPSVKKEIDAVVNLDADKRFVKRTSFLDDKFNQINFFKSFKDGTSLVHISTHFKASGNQVNETKMLLGDGSTMSLEDIRNKLPQISSNLVTLSACNTGSVISSGTGKSYEGLSNVFQLKGAKNVISTLWEISDQGSADFMIIFYSLLFNNPITPSQALSYTQTIFRTGSSSFLPPNLALKQDKLTSSVMNHIKDYSNPYFWAAFQISAIN
jgi:CHAT domain-containing protein